MIPEPYQRAWGAVTALPRPYKLTLAVAVAVAVIVFGSIVGGAVSYVKDRQFERAEGERAEEREADARERQALREQTARAEARALVEEQAAARLKAELPAADKHIKEAEAKKVEVEREKTAALDAVDRMSPGELDEFLRTGQLP
jgi:uncharacterized protein HemX